MFFTTILDESESVKNAIILAPILVRHYEIQFLEVSRSETISIWLSDMNLTCDCGACVVQFNKSAPKFVAQCCCTDCPTRVKATGRTLADYDQIFTDRKDTPWLAYWPNKFTLTGDVEFVKLREGSDAVSALCDKCKSTMVITHPAYAGNSVSTLPFATKHTNAEKIDAKDAEIRWWTKDWEEEELKRLAPLPGGWVDHENGGGFTSDDMEVLGAVFGKLQGNIDMDGPGTTFGAILGQNSVRILHVPVDPRGHKMKFEASQRV